MALAYMQMGDYDEALRYFNRTIEIDPSLAVAYADRGIMYDRMGKFRLAKILRGSCFDTTPAFTFW